MRRRRRGTTRVAGVVFATVAILAAGSPAASSGARHAKKVKPAAAAPAGFCSAPVVDNYWAPVEKLRPIPPVPEGGVLPFGPAGTTLAATGPQRLLVGGAGIGFRLTNGAPAASARPRPLNWIVLGRLIRFTGKDHNLQPAGLKRIDLKHLPAGKHRGFAFPLPATPALYSLEVTIQNHRGRLLGRYGEYVRVLERKLEAGLTLATYDKLVPGSYLESCFENHGTASVTPTGTSLERFDGSTWRPVTVGPQYSPAQSPIQRTLGPGEAERIATLIPPNARPGLYKLNATGTTELGEPVALSAEFGVL